jgi:hypothetical protein
VQTFDHEQRDHRRRKDDTQSGANELCRPSMSRRADGNEQRCDRHRQRDQVSGSEAIERNHCERTMRRARSAPRISSASFPSEYVLPFLLFLRDFSLLLLELPFASRFEQPLKLGGEAGSNLFDDARRHCLFEHFDDAARVVDGIGKLHVRPFALANTAKELVSREALELDIAAKMASKLLRQLRRKMIGCRALEPFGERFEHSSNRRLCRASGSKAGTRLNLAYEFVVCHRTFASC